MLSLLPAGLRHLPRCRSQLAQCPLPLRSPTCLIKLPDGGIVVILPPNRNVQPAAAAAGVALTVSAPQASQVGGAGQRRQQRRRTAMAAASRCSLICALTDPMMPEGWKGMVGAVGGGGIR